jgi:glycosyltransferase involved in cell wall biosynthesis
MGLKVMMIGAYPLEPGNVVGGIESVTSTLVPALVERDDIEHVTVLRFHNGSAPVEYRSEGPKVDVFYLRGQDRLRTVTRSFGDLRQARELVADIKPDVIHGQEIGWFGDIATRCGPASVVTVHGMPHLEIRLSARNNMRDRLRIKPIDHMVQQVLRRAGVVISISEYDALQLGERVCGQQRSIPNPAGTEFFELSPPGLTGPRLLFAGVLTPRKNPLGLLRAFSRVRREFPESQLIMAGTHLDQDHARQVVGLVDELGLSENVEITGQLNNHRLREEIVAARAIVLFSRQETAPTIIAQAMAAGKPVVATRVGGVAEMVIDSETGFLVDSEDEAAMAERLITILDDQERCLRMGNCANKLARSRFAPNAVAQLTAEAYRSALV